jgi:hypothetical protein
MSSSGPNRIAGFSATSIVVAALFLGNVFVATPVASATKRKSKPPMTTKPSSPASQSAVGTLTVNGKVSNLRYGYAQLVKGFFDPTKNDVRVFLSDIAATPALMNDNSALQKLAEEGKLHAFVITIDSTGLPVSTSFLHNGFTGPAPSGLDSSDVFTKTTFNSKLIDARYKSSETHEFFGDKYAFDVAFKLVVAPKSV